MYTQLDSTLRMRTPYHTTSSHQNTEAGAKLFPCAHWQVTRGFLTTPPPHPHPLSPGLLHSPVFCWAEKTSQYLGSDEVYMKFQNRTQKFTGQVKISQ